MMYPVNQLPQHAVLTRHIALSGGNSSAALEKLPKSDSSGGTFTSYHNIDRISQPISYQDFFQNYLLQNKPCIFGSFMTEDWPSRKDWVKIDGSRRPDFEFLKSQFGDVTVPVANCKKVQYDAQPKEDMTLTDFLKYWQEHIEQDYESEKGCLYMKDMHFTRDCSFYKAYTTPVYFTSDWLNEFWDNRTSSTDSCQDDYRFVYMGPKGSWTPFHADVFRSFSWSANVCGKKRWILVPPGQEVQLQDHLGNLPYDLTSCDNTASSKGRLFQETNYTPIEVVQSAGEVIFVPSGWHHQVHNLEDTISINHNWFNGTSISRSFLFLQDELTKVQKSIDDCRDMDSWEQQCQLILKASSGMDYQEFFQLLVSVSRRRLNVIRDCLDVENNLSSTTVQYQGHETLSCDQSGDKLSCADWDDRFTHKAHLHSDRRMECPVSTEYNIPAEMNSSEDMNIHGHLSHDKSHDNIAARPSSKSTTFHVQNTNITETDCKLETDCKHETDCKYWDRSLTLWHAVYDLSQIRRVLEDFINDKNVKLLEIKHQDIKPDGLQEEIICSISRIISSNLSDFL